MFQTGEDQGGAVMPSETPGAVSSVSRPDDVDASIAKARELGGPAARSSPCRARLIRRMQGHGGRGFSLWQGDESAA